MAADTIAFLDGVGGDDDVVRLEHTVALYLAIPDPDRAVIPHTSHAMVIEKPDSFNRSVLDFLEHEPPPTMIPVRRAATS